LRVFGPIIYNWQFVIASCLELLGVYHIETCGV